MPEGCDGFARALAESLGFALEEMFFVSEFPPCDAGAELRGARITARVDFVGARSGSPALRTGSDSPRALAANFLAEGESSLEAQQVEAVLAELANMVCCGVLTRTAPHCILRLSSPQVSAAPPRSPVDAFGGRCGSLWRELSIEEAP